MNYSILDSVRVRAVLEKAIKSAKSTEDDITYIALMKQINDNLEKAEKKILKEMMRMDNTKRWYTQSQEIIETRKQGKFLSWDYIESIKDDKEKLLEALSILKEELSTKDPLFPGETFYKIGRVNIFLNKDIQEK